MHTCRVPELFTLLRGNTSLWRARQGFEAPLSREGLLFHFKMYEKFVPAFCLMDKECPVSLILEPKEDAQWFSHVCARSRMD